MIYNIYAMRDELTGFLPPTYDINDAAAMRNFRVAILRSSEDLLTKAKILLEPIVAPAE